MELVTSEPVLVTGGTGFLAAHLIQQLLVRGYRVRVTVRSPSQAAAVFGAYGRISGVHERLEIMEADLTKEDRWDDVLRGIQYVCHCAALPYESKYSPEQYTKVIIEGTKRLLDMCVQAKTVKKFIHFSCLCALAEEFDSNRVYSEEDWNDVSSLDRCVYAYSKTASEQIVLEYNNRGLQTVSIVPGMLWGPAMNKEYSYSYRFLMLFLSGVMKQMVNLNYNISDVRDVAAAALQALEQDRIQGRYILTHPALSLSDILTTVHECFPDIKVPTRILPDAIVRFSIATEPRAFKSEFLRCSVGRSCRVRGAGGKAAVAGLVMRPPVQTIRDTVRHLLEHDLLDPTVVSNKTGVPQTSCTIM